MRSTRNLPLIPVFHDQNPMNPEDNDKLWALLGEAKPPQVSPFFSRNILRSIREGETATPASRFRLGLAGVFRRWAWRLAVAGACLTATLVTVIPRQHRHEEEAARLEGKILETPDYEVVKHLDELVADEESSVWLDDSVN